MASSITVAKFRDVAGGLQKGQFAVRAVAEISRTAIAATQYGLPTGMDLETASWINQRIPNPAAIAIEINVGR